MGQCAHLRNYASLPGCRVVALAEPRPLLARRVAEKYGVANVYASADEMLAKETLDGIVAPQPFTHHEQLVAPLYRYGLPVLTEKPLAASVAGGERMLQALKKGGSWHMVGYHKRSDPATEWLQTEVQKVKQSGEMGAMRYVRITMPAGDWVAGGFYDLVQTEEKPPSLAPDAPPEDMDESSYYAYLAFVNYYIHQVNLMRYLLGESYQVSFADKSGVLLATQSESGVAGTIEMSPYSTTLGWHEAALVAFEKGYFKLELPAPVALNQAGRVEMFRDGEAQTVVPQMPPVHAMRRQAENFVAAIRGDIAPRCQAAEALEDLRVARQYLQLFQS